MTSIAFIISVITTLFCVGISWFLQLVHYPLYRLLGAERYPEYHASFRLKMIILCFPLMFMEAATSIMVFLSFSFQPKLNAAMENSFMLYGISVFLLLIIHLITFRGVQPITKQLSLKFEEKSIASLLQWNLMRTITWTVRALLMLLTMITVG